MKRLTLAFTLALGLALLGASNSNAGTLTPATGGTVISAGTVGGAWTALTGPVYAESAGGDVGTGTIILNVPAGFIFDTSCCPLPTIRIDGGSNSGLNINNSVSGGVTPLTVTSTQLTFTVSSKSSVPNTLTWQNLRVRPTAVSPLATGNITKSGSSSMSGVANGVTNFGTLTEIAGVPTKMFVTLPNQTFTTGSGNSGAVANQTVATAFNISVLTAVDDSTNIATSYSGTKTISYSGPSGSPTYTTSVNFSAGQSTTTLATTLNTAETTTITATDGSLTGVPSSSLTVVKKILTVSGLTANNKVYDGNTSVTLNTGSAVLVGVASGDSVALNTGSAAGAFATKTVGSGKTVTVSGLTISGANAGNYTLTQPTTTADITVATVTGSITANSKVYDGTTTATIATRTLSGVIGADVVSLTGGTATFADKNVGAGKTVMATGLGLTGADAGNYQLASTSASTTADITARTLTVSATGVNKVYDGTTAATVTLSDNRVAGDILTTGYTSAAFADKNVGTAKTVSVSGITVTGTDAGNYTFNTTASTTANITGATVTGSITANSKVYDGTNTATIATRTLSGVIGADVVSLTGGTATFANKNVGTSKTVTTTGLSLSGADAGNYQLAATSASTTADITARAVTVSATGVNKVYDGTTTATVTLSDNRVAGDVLTTGYTSAAFADKNVGTGKTVSVSGITVTGTDAGNYTFNTTASTTANITAATVAGSITANSKVYDGTNTATIATRTLSGVIGSDVVSLTGGTATFPNKNAGAGKIVTATGLGLSGTDAGNYQLASTGAGTTADITARTLTISATGVNKAYDGTATATVTLSDNRVAGDVLTTAYTSAAFADANVGTGKAVSVSGITLTGTDAGNYTFNTTASTTANITQGTLTVTADNLSRIYGAANPAFTATYTGFVGGDNASVVSGSPSFSTSATTNSAVGSYTITVTQGTLSAANYSFSFATGQLTVGKATVTGNVTASNKVYDGTMAATIATRTLSGALFGDDVSLSGGTATFGDKNLGTGKTVTATSLGLTGTKAGNYQLVSTTATTTANITAKGLTVTGVTANNKVYDSTTTATLNTASAALVGAVGGDSVTLSTAGATGAFADKNVGTGKTVTVSGLTISGADAGNYTLTQPTATANITAKALTVTATGIDKVYDATTAATVTLSDNRVAGDVLTATNTSATFASATVGSAKTVTVGGISISGTDAGNYTANTTASTTANITAKALTVTGITANNKTYDATTTATLNTASAVLVGKVSGDTVTLSTASATGAFADKNIGTGKTVTISALTISGTSAGNYTLTQPTTTANITARSLTVSATGANKAYDGTTATTVTLSDNRVAGDVLTTSYTSAAFATKTAGTAKTVNVSGISISGADAGNYTANTTASATANITAATLVGSITASSKVYDGTTAATIATRSLSGVIGVDVVSLTGGTATFADKNVGAGKTVTATGLGLTGTDAANYTVNTTATATADITARALTISATGVNKVYDSTTIATVTLSDNRAAGDVLTTGYTSAVFTDKNVGTAKAVSVSGLTLTGTDAGNYTFNTTTSATANITTRAITVTAVTDTKAYDGTTSSAPTPTITSGSLASGDTANFSQAFSSATVGTGKTLIPSGSVNDGNSGNNYTVTFANNTTGVISAKALTVSGVTASSKVYDGTTAATLNTASAALVGVTSGDTVTLNTVGASGAFADKNVGTAKAVTVSGLSLSGASAGNYTLTQPTATADITVRAITVTAATNTKTYDNTTSAAAVPTITVGSLASGDTANFPETYDTKAAGTGKTLTPTGSVTDGNSGNNYTVTFVNNITGVITAKSLTVTGVTANNKVYDSTTTATLNTASAALVGVAGGDSVTLSTVGATGAFADKNVGAGKTVTVSGLTISGASASNYTLTQPTTTANITAKALTVTATGIDKVYDATTAATVTLSDNRVAGDVLTATNTSATFASATVGSAKTVTVSGITISGADAANYTANTTASTTANITAKPLTVTGITANNKTYDGALAATLNTASAALVGKVSGDTVTLSAASATGAFADKNIGTGKTVTVSGLTISGTSAGNYTLTQPTTTANITAKGLTVSGVTANNKVYDATTAATLSTASAALVGVVGGDAVTLNTAGVTGTFADPNIGSGKTVAVSGLTISGTDAPNYNLTQPTATANITAKGLTVSGVTANNKVYDATTAATLSTASAALVGVVSGDTVTLSAAGATGVFANKNVGTAKTVAISGLTISGASASNYTLTQPTTTADITGRALTVSATGVNKGYDGTTTATVTLSDNRVAGDVLTTAYTSAAFADENVGTAKSVSVSGITVTGTDSANYTANTTASATANITARAITVTAVTDTKAYDGTTSSAQTPTITSGSLASGDTANFAQAFSTATVGTGKTLVPSGSVNDGNSGNNYTVTLANNTTGVITAKALTVGGITANTRVYDGTTATTLNTASAALVGVASGDTITLNTASATGAFANKNVGTAKTVTVSGLTISGASASNYTLTQPTATADITVRAITVTAATNTKTYDNTTSAAAVPTITTGSLASGDTANFSETYDTKSAGTGKTLTPAGSVTDGNSGNNYTVTLANNTTGVITAKALTVSGITANNKAYDGTTAATLNTASAALVGVVGGDSVTLGTAGATGAFADKNVGTGKTVTVSGLTIGGASASNYTLTQPSATANITAKALTVTATGIDKVYDATTAATVTLSDNRVAGDVLTASNTSAIFASATVGSAKTVSVSGITISGADAGNYTVNTTASTTANITAKALTVTGITANNKAYDGTTTATLNTGGAVLVGGISGDHVSLSTGSATGAFADNNAGTGKTVTISGLTLSGTDAGNYTLTQPMTTANITARSLTVSVTGVNKVYDGTTTTTVTLSDNRLAGDVLTTSYTSAAFATKTVGTAKTVSVSGIAISGADAGNYTANTTASTTANITAATLTGSITANSKAYDGTTAATIATRVLSGVIGADVVSLTGGTATFANKNVGTAKTVTATGLSLTGTDAGNYTVNSTATATADITGRTLTISATGVNKAYDGTTTATVTLSDNRVAGDVLTTAYTSAAFADKNVGTGKSVSVSGITVTGTDAGNYTFNTTTSTTASITARAITVTAVTDSKVYDGTTSSAQTPTITAGSLISGDTANFAQAFSTATVGTGKTLIPSGSINDGNSGNNYAVTFASNTTGVISAKALTVSGVTANTKVYDATTAATLNTASAALVGAVNGDTVTLNTAGATSVFADKNVGTAKTVTISGLTLSGASAGNYSLTQPTAAADITARTLTVSATGVNKVYDGTTATTVTLSDNRVAGDVLTTAYTSATFADKTIGIGKTVNVSGITVTGTDAGNYTFNTTTSTTANITAKGLTVTGVSANNKVYDGTTTATLNTGSAALIGVASGDTVTLDTSVASGTFASKTVGTAKAVTIGGIAIGGADAGNYTLTQPATTANITARTLTVSATGVNKVYDGTTATTVTLADNRVAGDVLTTSYTTAAFADKNVGTGKTVNVSGITVTGTDAGNYTFNTTTSTTANITAKTLTISATGVNKVYDSTTTATVTLSDNRVAGDVLTTAYTSATFANKNVGTGKTVSVSGITVTGTDAGNYTANTTASTTANITTRAITVTAVTDSKVYDGTTSSAQTPTITAGSLISGDTANFTQAFSSATVGTGKTLVPSGSVTDGNSGNNYTVTLANNITGVITAKALTVSAISANTKVYDATTAATLSTASAALVGVVSGDTVTLNTVGATGTFANKSVGTAKTVTISGLTLSGASAGNYSLTQPTAAADITARTLTVSATGMNKVYDGTTATTVTLSDNRVAGDVLTTAYTSATFTDKTIGIGKTVNVSGITVTGTDAGNYTFNTTATTTANITAKGLSVTGVIANNRVYDGTTTATLNTGSAALIGVASGDTVTLDTTAASGAFASKTVGTGKAVAISGIAIAGADAGNYTLTQPSTTANITARPLTVSATGVNKVYDGTTTATVTLSDNRVAGDVLTTAYTSAVFADKNVGTAKTVNVSGITVTGTDSGNYTFNTTTSTTANITAKTLTVSATGVNKVYDGTATATVTLSDNRVAGDVLTTGYTSAAFADKNIGTGKAVSVSGITVTGTDSGNYTGNTAASTTANITAKSLTVSGLTANNKVYDGTTTATLNTGGAALVGVAIGDTVTLNTGSATGAFANKTVGTNKTVTVSGLTISGTDAGNYTLTQPAATANITAASLTVSATGVNKVYDGTTNATVTLTDNRVAGDVLTTSYTTASFADKTVGTGKTVSVSGISVTGTDASNYTFNTTTTTTANITARALTVSATGVNKVYDGTTTATVTLSDNRVAGDVLTTAYTTASFADSLVGTAKPVSVSGITVTGTDAGNYTFNTTATTTANITRSPTTTTVSSSQNPSTFGQSVTFTATVTGTNGTPTGTVTFKDGATALGTNTLSSGQTTLTTSLLAGGSHSITAVYNGDTTFTNSTSVAVTQTVGKGSSTTTLSSSSANPSVYGQSVSFTATVTGTNGTPTGTVTFMDGATTLGTNTLASGQATFTSTTLSAGPHSITAVYNGDGNFNTSTSSALSQTVNKSDTTTALTSSANPSVSGQSVTFTATINPVAPGAGTRTGTVQFAIDGVNFGAPLTLSGGSATSAATNSLSLGSHTITAVYSGDSNFNSSAAPNLSQTVNMANSTTLVTSSINPSYFNQQVTFTATVSAVAPGSGTPTSTVQFTIDGTNFGGAVTLSGGTAASSPTSLLSVTNHTIRAVYSGDGNFIGSTSANLTQTVSPSPLRPATGGLAISNTTVGGAYTTLTGPVYLEPAASAVGSGTIVLNVASGFAFDTNATVTVLVDGDPSNANHNINHLADGSTIAVTVTTNALTATIAQTSGSGTTNQLTWQGIRVRPTASAPLASGNITKSGSSAMTGITDGVTNFGTLNEVAVLNHFAFAAISSPQTPSAPFNITITAQDQSNNTVTTFTGTVNLSTTAGTISPSVSGSFTNGQRTESVTVTGIGTNLTISATRTGGTETGTSSPFTVCGAPAITGQPAVQTLCAGGNASFTVSATGLGLTYQWQKNGSNISNGGTISGATTPTLTLTSVASGDSGATFDCVVSGICSPSATSSAAALTVNTAPAITGQPAAQTLCVGGNASYAVTATGTALTYQWQKNGSNIGNGGTISGATSPTLTLTGVASGDSGATFDCVVSGTCSPAATSGTAALTVNTAPAITGQPAAQTLCAGGNASYAVTATGTALTYQWQKNGSNISNGGTISGATSATLTLTGVAGGDSGATFDCVVSGTCSPPATSGTAALTVNTAPTITCPANITTNNAAGICGQVVTFAASATGSPAPIITYSQNSGTTFPVGTNTVNCTASNVCGTTNCTFNVIVNAQPPVITCPADVFTNTDLGQCTVSNVVIGTATATDDCEVATLVSDAPGDLTFSMGTNRVVWTATNIYGNQSTCTQLVIVVNIEPPTISGCPTNLTVSCATDVPAPDISSIVATDNCSAVTVSWLSDTISNQTCPNRYTVLRIYQATDASGNSATCTQTITVDDETAPVITSNPADTTVSCAAAVPTADDTAVSATDNCGGAVTVTHDADVISGQSCANRYSISRTYHATDACGNTSSITQTITVNDTTGPVLSGVPSATTVSCDAVPGATTVTATDDCDGSVTVSFNEVRTDGNCPNNYSLTRTWTATDACGNTSSATQTLTVHDTTGPVLSGQGADASIESLATPVFSAPAATDNCDAAPVLSFSDATNQLCSSAYKVTRTWTATDACGNVSAPVSQTITVGDATPPTISCPADVLTNTDLGLCTVSNVVIGTATATNNSGGHVTVINDAPGTFPTGTNAVVWTATDGCGNSSSCTQQVIVVDNEPPTISGCPTNLTVSCAGSVPVPDISSVTATDNCSAVTVSWLSDTITNQTCPNRYTVLRAYQATDASGNSATCTQTITVADETAPTITASPANTTVSCASAVPAADDSAVSATANCGDAVTVTHDADVISAQSCANRYNISRTYHVTDSCGNSASVTQTITVNDTTGPVLNGVPSDAPASCDAVPAATATVTATDDCDGSVTVGFNEVRTDGNCPNSYTLTRTWTATDACGNTSSASQTLTVQDTTGPVLSGQGADATIESPATPSFNAPMASDNCGSAPTISFSDTTNQLCGSTYKVTRTWTATDACGNVSAPVHQTITVGDTTAPTISCPVDVLTNTDLGLCTVSNVVLGTASGSDNSGGHVTVINDAPGTFPTGTNAVVWTATDGCGNSSSCTQQVIVVDNEPPTISGCPTNLTVSCVSSVPVPDISSIVATDNCSAVTVSWLSDTITNQTCPNRYTMLRAYQATDASGNSATCTQTITVDNETVPVITASPANTTVSCATAVPAADDTAVSATANCGNTVTVTHDADVISGQSCANRYTISRVYHATDACGNTASVTQMITVNDTIGPVLSGVPTDAAAACDAVPAAATVTANDNCDGSVSVSFSQTSTQTASGCGQFHYTITRIWTATDACGNATSATQTLTIADSSAPVIHCPVDQQLACGTSTAPGQTGTATATDNCDPNPTIGYTDTPTAANCTGQAGIDRTWTATDACGNSASCVQHIRFIDTTPPVISCPSDVTVSNDTGECYASGVILGTPTASDNCASSGVVVNDAPAQFPIGTNRVVWTVTDDCGNSATCTQLVIVVDSRPAPWFRIVSIKMEGGDVRVTWTATGGSTNVLQAASSLSGNSSNSFADISTPIVTVGCGEVTTNWLDIGAASGTPARYYRVRLVP